MIQWDTLAKLLREYIELQPTIHPQADDIQTEVNLCSLQALASQMKNLLVGQQYPPDQVSTVKKVNSLAGALYSMSEEADLAVANEALSEIESIRELSDRPNGDVKKGVTPPAATNMAFPPSVGGIIAALPQGGLTATRRDEAEKVLEILFSSDDRQTAREIQDAMRKKGWKVSEKKLKEILSLLKKEGFLVNPNDKKGYGVTGMHEVK